MYVCVRCVLIAGVGLGVKLWDMAGASTVDREGHVEEPSWNMASSTQISSLRPLIALPPTPKHR